MARGEKFCSHCGTRNGPRAWNCSFCGTGFTVKGKVYPDIKVVALHNVNNAADEKLIAMVRICEDPHEKNVREKYYGTDSKTFETIDGKFRIRYGAIFMGINIGDDKPYKLMYHKNDSWELVKGKNRFHGLIGAIKFIRKMSNSKLF